MTYQPFLPEAAAGAIEPRHLTVPLRRVLRRCDVDDRRGRGGRRRAAPRRGDPARRRVPAS